MSWGRWEKWRRFYSDLEVDCCLLYIKKLCAYQDSSYKTSTYWTMLANYCNFRKRPTSKRQDSVEVVSMIISKKIKGRNSCLLPMIRDSWESDMKICKVEKANHPSQVKVRDWKPGREKIRGVRVQPSLPALHPLHICAAQESWPRWGVDTYIVILPFCVSRSKWNMCEWRKKQVTLKIDFGKEMEENCGPGCYLFSGVEKTWICL